MTFDEYQCAAARTINSGIPLCRQELHALHGMAAELGEIHSLFQKVYQGHAFDNNHLIKEIGDLWWMMNELCTARGIRMNDVAETNIRKLIDRYPNGFEAEKSLHRKEGDI